MNNQKQEATNVLQSLQNLQTIRQQAQRLLNLARQNKLNYFSFAEEKIPATVDYVVKVIYDQYPTLKIPYHSRWRHFAAGGIDRIKKIQPQLNELSQQEQGKILYEAVIISVLLDAGAGKKWHYHEFSTGEDYTRSEGLAIASLELYLNGAFSANSQQPWRVDATKLLAFSKDELIHAFQVTQKNYLEGIEGRVNLLNRLGAIVETSRFYFGEDCRLGNFYSYIMRLQKNHSIAVRQIFQAVLAVFAKVWPERLRYHNVPLGDVGIHSALKTATLGSEFVPFHKLSQWLTYSLIEPLEQFDIKVTDIEELTALPEYRNGGLLIDMGVLQAKNAHIFSHLQPPDSEVIVEWRALTIAILDELAKVIRQRLKMNTEELPLAKILQGGTWEAGRQIARQKRKEGIPRFKLLVTVLFFNFYAYVRDHDE